MKNIIYNFIQIYKLNLEVIHFWRALSHLFFHSLDIIIIQIIREKKDKNFFFTTLAEIYVEHLFHDILIKWLFGKESERKRKKVKFFFGIY